MTTVLKYAGPAFSKIETGITTPSSPASFAIALTAGLSRHAWARAKFDSSCDVQK
jgi:hypothetical protein